MGQYLRYFEHRCVLVLWTGLDFDRPYNGLLDDDYYFKLT